MKWILRIISALMLWLALAYMVIKIEPESVKDIGIAGAYLPFTTLAALVIWYTVFILTESASMAIIISALVILALVLSILALMNWLTWIVIALLIVFSLYLHKRRDSIDESDKK